MKRKYAIVDIETTGGVLKRDKIIEIAIILHDGEKILDQFQSLVNPGYGIPKFIQRLTGIRDEMVVDAPHFYEIARRIVEMTTDAVFVAHNVRFDYSFIREEFKQLGYNYTRKQLCTVRLSKLINSELRKHSLDTLIRYFGLKINNRHRAYDDAFVTTEILCQMLNSDLGEQHAETIINCGIQSSKLPIAIDLEQLHELPEACGVYYFYNKFGNVIYVGKSINIKKRVMQHFAKFSAKANKLQQQVANITYQLTGSELVALLLESHEIKHLNPSINKSQRKKLFPFGIYAYTNEEGYIELRAEKVKKDIKDIRMVKEYPKIRYARYHLKGLLEEFSLCAHLCGDKTGVDSCFNLQIGKCHGACLGQETPELYNQRVEEAIAYLQREVKDSFYLIDQGRTIMEKSIVKVEDGKFRGFGFLEEGTVVQNHSGFDDFLTEYPNTRDAQRLIHWYMRENKMEEVIYVEEVISRS